MCLAIPGKVMEVDGKWALVEYDGILRKARIDFLSVKEGDWVMVHAGYAIEKVDEKKAKESLAIWRKMMEKL